MHNTPGRCEAYACSVTVLYEKAVTRLLVSLIYTYALHDLFTCICNYRSVTVWVSPLEDDHEGPMAIIRNMRRLIAMLNDIHKYYCPIIPVIFDANESLLDLL